MDARRKERLKTAGFVLLFVLSMGVVIWSQYHFYKAKWDVYPAWPLPVFYFASAGLAVCYARIGRSNLRLFFSFYLMGHLLLWMYGVVGGLIVALALRYYRPPAEELHDDYFEQEMLFEDDPEYEDATSYEEIIRSELNVQSYMDIIRGDSLELKKILISKISKAGKMRFIPILKEALDDDNYEIRSFATTTLTKFEKFMNDAIAERKRRLAADFDMDNASRLVTLYIQFLASGLLDDNGRRHYLGVAVDLIRQMKDKPTLISKRMGVKLICIDIKMAEVAHDKQAMKQIYKKTLTQYPKQRKIITKLAGIMMQERDLEGLAARCNQLKALQQYPEPAVRMWTRGVPE